MAKKQHKKKKQVRRNVKDRLFRYLFEKDRKALLQLYNALHGTDYQDDSQLEIVTIKSVVYVVMKNDLAFVMTGVLNIYEHQSTYNPNLPVRFLIYLAQEYQMVIQKAQQSLYGMMQITLPTPQCIVFYNGKKDMPEEEILRLSDAFENRTVRPDIELTVRVININSGHNCALMEQCRTLAEYSEFVGVTREFMAGADHAETALSDAVDYCIEKGILADFLKKNRAEVLGMLLEEFDAEKYERTLRSEGKEEGRKEGKEEGIEEEREEGIRYMIEILQELGQSVDYVKEKLKEKYSLSEKEAQEKQQLYWK